MIGRRVWSTESRATMLGLLLVISAVAGAPATTCAKVASDGVTMNGKCSSATLEVPAGEFQFEMTYDGNKQFITGATLIIGECKVKGDVVTGTSYGPNLAIRHVLPFYFPITGTINEDGISLKDKDHDKTFSCRSQFEKTKSGSWIVPVKFQSKEVVTELNFVFKKAKLYTGKVDEAGGWKMWTAIAAAALLILVLIVASIVVGVRWYKDKKMYKQAEILLKFLDSNLKPEVNNPVEDGNSKLEPSVGSKTATESKNQSAQTPALLTEATKAMKLKAAEEAKMGEMKNVELNTAEEAGPFMNVQWSWPTKTYDVNTMINLLSIIGKPTTEKICGFLGQFPLLKSKQKKALSRTLVYYKRIFKHQQFREKNTQKETILKTLQLLCEHTRGTDISEIAENPSKPGNKK